MTDGRTPLQRLDDAVHAFAAEAGVEGTVGAWALAYEVTRIVDEPGAQPLADAQAYALGPGTTTATAAGLTAALAALCQQHGVGSMSSSPDQDDES